MESRQEVRLDLWYDSGCVRAERIRERVRAGLAGLELGWSLHEHVDEGVLSPTLLVDGADVVSARAPAQGCRLDLPTVTQIRDAVQRTAVAHTAAQHAAVQHTKGART